jgi:hypothetical protein
MRVYRVMVQGDKYPTEYSVQASNIATAAARGIREWHERFKGKRLPDELKVKIIRGGELIKADEK